MDSSRLPVSRRAARKKGPGGPPGTRKEARPGSSAGSESQFVAIARIARPWGRRGEVVADVLTDFPSRFKACRRVFLEERGAPAPAELESARLHQDRVVLKFSGTDSIPEAEGLRGRYVFIRREERIRLAPGYYYRSDLRGFQVVRETGHGQQTLGIVEEVEETGGVDVLRVATPRGEALIPLAQTICTRIDPEAGIIVVDPPEGLLEANLLRPRL